MSKNKIAKWAELAAFPNVVQHSTGYLQATDHHLKGKWKRDMFANENPLVIELGCGKGEYTTGLSFMFPEKNFIGVDIKGARMWRGARTALEQKLDNAAFIRTRIEFIDLFFDTDEVDEIWLTFPDPHPGSKNSGKRLTSPWFLNKYRKFLKHKGIVNLKTDSNDLYEYTLKLAVLNGLEILLSTKDLHGIYNEKKDAGSQGTGASDIAVIDSRDPLLIRTYYEDIFVKNGLKIHYLSFRLEKDKIISDGRREA